MRVSGENLVRPSCDGQAKISKGSVAKRTSIPSPAPKNIATLLGGDFFAGVSGENLNAYMSEANIT